MKKFNGIYEVYASIGNDHSKHLGNTFLKTYANKKQDFTFQCRNVKNDSYFLNFKISNFQYSFS